MNSSSINVGNEGTMSVGNISAEILQKQREMNTLNDIRFNTLENTIRRLESELKQEKMKNAQLVTDFNYNLAVINERDKELDSNAVFVEQLRDEIRKKFADLFR